MKYSIAQTTSIAYDEKNNYVLIGYQKKGQVDKGGILRITPAPDFKLIDNIDLEGVECISIPEIKWSLNYILSRTQRVFQRVIKINISKPLENILGHSFTFFNDSSSITKAVNTHYSDEELIITLSKGASFRSHLAMLSLPKLHSKWLAYVHDPYPFHYYPRPYNWVESGYRYKEDFFRHVSEKAKFSGFPSLLLKEWMGSYFFNFLNTGIIIPHQNLEIKKNKKNDYPEYFDVNKFNLLHAGNLMSKRDPRFLVTAFLDFLKENPESKNEAKLIFLGNAGYHKNYMDEVVSDVIYWSGGNVPYKKVEIVQNNSSVNIILEAKSEISPFLPGKFPNCVAANKPILLLSPYYGESKRLLGNDYPFICEMDDVKLIKKHITTLYVNWKEKKNQSLNRKDLELYLGVEYLKEIMEKTLNG